MWEANGSQRQSVSKATALTVPTPAIFPAIRSTQALIVESVRVWTQAWQTTLILAVAVAAVEAAVSFGRGGRGGLFAFAAWAAAAVAVLGGVQISHYLVFSATIPEPGRPSLIDALQFSIRTLPRAAHSLFAMMWPFILLGVVTILLRTGGAARETIQTVRLLLQMFAALAAFSGVLTQIVAVAEPISVWEAHARSRSIVRARPFVLLGGLITWGVGVFGWLIVERAVIEGLPTWGTITRALIEPLSIGFLSSSLLAMLVVYYLSNRHPNAATA